MDIRKRINDAVVQSRVDSRVLAELTQFYVKRGVIAKGSGTLAGMVRMALEDLAELVVKNEESDVFLSFEDAREYLDQIFNRANLNPSGRGLANLQKGFQADSLAAERRVYPGRRVTKDIYDASPVAGMSKEEIDKEVRASMRRMKDIKSQTNYAKEHFAVKNEPMVREQIVSKDEFISGETPLEQWEEKSAAKIPLNPFEQSGKEESNEQE